MERAGICKKNIICCEIPFIDCESGLFEIGLQGALNSISIPQLKDFFICVGKILHLEVKDFSGICRN